MEHPDRCHVSFRHRIVACLAVLANLIASGVTASHTPRASVRLLHVNTHVVDRDGSHNAASELVAGRGAENAVTYGPGKCVALWQNGHGHCAIGTKCKDHDIDNYPVKLICEKNGEKVRHVFAEGSFAAEEEFDTLISCSRCIAFVDESGAPEDALEEEPASAALNNLRSKLQNLTNGMVKQSRALQKLNAKVFNIKVEVEEEGAGEAETSEEEASEDSSEDSEEDDGSEKEECDLETGGTCKFLYCYAWRGETTCDGGKCLCKEGYCAKDGKCVKQDADTSAAADVADTTNFVHHGATRHRRLHKQSVVVHRRARVPNSQRLPSVSHEMDTLKDVNEEAAEKRFERVAAPTATGVLSAASSLRQLAASWASEAEAAAESATSGRPARLLRGFAGEEKDRGAPSMASEIKKSEEASLLQKKRRLRRISNDDDSDESDKKSNQLPSPTDLHEEEPVTEPAPVEDSSEFSAEELLAQPADLAAEASEDSPAEAVAVPPEDEPAAASPSDEEAAPPAEDVAPPVEEAAAPLAETAVQETDEAVEAEAELLGDAAGAQLAEPRSSDAAELESLEVNDDGSRGDDAIDDAGANGDP